MLIKRKERNYVGYYFKMNKNIDDDATIFYVKGINEYNKYVITWNLDGSELESTYPISQANEYFGNQWIII